MIHRLLFGLAATVSSVGAAYCNGAPDPGLRTNDLPIFEEQPRFVRSVDNAALYMAGPDGTSSFPIVHVYGNAYEVGFANGKIQQKYMTEFIGKTYDYFVGMALDEMGDKIPPYWQAQIILKGLNGALDWCAEVTAPFTPQEFYDELHGLADGSGLDYQTLLRLNMFAELTKASCSFFGAWGAATASTGHAYQLRALDYDTTGPFKDYPQVTVYHPSDGGHAFANVGWPGSIGMMTGFSAAQLGLSEIGVTYPDDSFGQGTDDTPPQKVRGEPWMFITRDVMKYSESLEDAVSYIQGANRTCNLIIGVGDGEESMVNGIEYSGYVAVPYSDDNLLPQNATWHAELDDVVYNGMDWLCPNYDSVLHDQLQTYHGSISEVNTIQNILPTVQTGDLHIAFYDLTASKMYISFMRKAEADENEPLYAYERQFVGLDMKSIFEVPQPSL